jgi:hypothetical protein
MSNLSVEYTGESFSGGPLASTPREAANVILAGYLPTNLTDLSTDSNFRDAVLGHVLTDTIEHDRILEVFCQRLRSCNDASTVLTIVEYTASIAYSWEHKGVAVNAIRRVQVERATPHLWSVAQALSKQMPGPFYQSLLTSQLSTAESNWQQMQ